MAAVSLRARRSCGIDDVAAADAAPELPLRGAVERPVDRGELAQPARRARAILISVGAAFGRRAGFQADPP
jgi:hypothetical protein